MLYTVDGLADAVHCLSNSLPRPLMLTSSAAFAVAGVAGRFACLAACRTAAISVLHAIRLESDDVLALSSCCSVKIRLRVFEQFVLPAT